MTHTMTTISIDKLSAALRRQTQQYKMPIWIWGASGIGKSAVVKQFSKDEAKRNGLIFWEVQFNPETGSVAHLPEGADPKDYWGFIDLRAVLLDILDVKGAPFVNREEGMTQFARASLLPEIARHGFRGTFFLDELAQAVPMVTNGFSQLIYDKRIGDSYSFPDSWCIISAGNRKEDNAATSKAGAHIYNRFGHYEVQPSPQALSDWMMRNGFDSRIAKFVVYQKELVHSYSKGDVVFPTPRTFETVSNIVSSQVSTGLTNLEMEQDIAAHIGVGAAAQVVAFLDCFNDLVPYSEIIDNPKRARTPMSGHGGATAATYALFSVLIDNVTERDMDAVMTYVQRFDEEFQAMFVLDVKSISEAANEEGARPELKKRAGALLETIAISKWRSDHPLVAV